jgi:hypothetical protein
MKDRVFWFHYNKPASSSAGKPKITVHYKGVCHLCDNIVVNVPTHGHLRKNQPRFVIKGKCKNLKFENEIAIIN